MLVDLVDAVALHLAPPGARGPLPKPPTSWFSNRRFFLYFLTPRRPSTAPWARQKSTDFRCKNNPGNLSGPRGPPGAPDVLDKTRPSPRNSLEDGGRMLVGRPAVDRGSLHITRKRPPVAIGYGYGETEATEEDDVSRECCLGTPQGWPTSDFAYIRLHHIATLAEQKWPTSEFEVILASKLNTTLSPKHTTCGRRNKMERAPDDAATSRGGLRRPPARHAAGKKRRLRAALRGRLTRVCRRSRPCLRRFKVGLRNHVRAARPAWQPSSRRNARRAPARPPSTRGARGATRRRRPRTTPLRHTAPSPSRGRRKTGRHASGSPPERE